MQKNKNLLALIALVCAVLALGLSVFSLISLGGSQARVALLEQKNAYLQEQLNTLAAINNSISSEAYCHLFVSDWEGDLPTLTLRNAVAQVTVTTSGNSELLVQSAQLVLRQDIREVSRLPVSLVAGDSNTSFEADLENVSFDLPQLEENGQVDLWLEVVLSDGQILLSPACGWYRSGTQLFMVAG